MGDNERQIIMLAMAVAVFFIAGIPAIVYLRERHTLRTWSRSTARIQLTFVDKQHTTSGAMTQSRVARYVFRTSDGALREGFGKVNGEPKVGDEVEVRYNPASPEKNSIFIIPKTTWYVLGIPWSIVFIAFSAVCVSDAFWSTMSN